MTPRILLLTCLLLAGWIAYAQDVEDEDPQLAAADEYLEAYARFDLEALGDRLDERSTFQDPTTAEIAGAGLSLRGKDAILAALSAATAGLEDLRLEYDERFHSGGYVVAIGRLRYRMPAAMLGPQARDALFDVRVVTVLQLEGGKLREHTDYTDLSGWMETVAAARR